MERLAQQSLSSCSRAIFRTATTPTSRASSQTPLSQICFQKRPLSSLHPSRARLGICSPCLRKELRLQGHNAPRLRTLPPSRGIKTVQEAATRFKIGPFSAVSVVLFLGTGVGMLYYFQYEKARVERQRIADMSKGVGKPKVGGLFELTDQNGNTWNSKEEMGGKFSLVYFGFSHCPDICPEELDKMAQMLDIVAERLPAQQHHELLPIFITCDPARDTPEVLKVYLKEFHPKLVGLTGTWEQIKAVCKLYRVYFSTPSGVKPGMDYLVDHSIYFYLMDPEGDFVEAIGRQHTAEQGAALMIDHISDWKGKG